MKRRQEEQRQEQQRRAKTRREREKTSERQSGNANGGRSREKERKSNRKWRDWDHGVVMGKAKEWSRNKVCVVTFRMWRQEEKRGVMGHWYAEGAEAVG